MRVILATVVLTAFLAVGSAFAADQAKGVDDQTKARVRAEIEHYVTADVRLKRYFFLMDPRNDRTLRLTFDHVHEGVSAGDKGYAACVDFKDQAGKLYDVDIFVSLGEDKAQVEDVVLHKVEGKPIEKTAKKGK